MSRGSAPGERRGGRAPGTPNKATADIKAIAQEYAPEALQIAASIMRNVGSPEASRIAAANLLLDRAYGKPAQHNTLAGDEERPLALQVLTSVPRASNDDDQPKANGHSAAH